MAGETPSEGLKERLSRQGEEALGRLAEELAANSVVSSAIAGAFEARERAAAADVERLTRRIRSVSQRLEGIEDTLDRIDERLRAVGDRLKAQPTENDQAALEALAADVAALREAVAPRAQAPRSQERLAATES